MKAEGQRAVLIPARRASTRLPEKLLLAASGRPLLAHTITRCLKASAADQVIVAVDDPELAAIAKSTGAKAVMTDSALASGSDRVWAAVQQFTEVQHIVNVQGDEAEIDPTAIDAVFQALAEGAQVATLSAPLPVENVADPAAVKVVSDLCGRALYFSRAPIPFARNEGQPARLHVGVYGYTRSVLEAFAAHPPTPLETTEGLEQLRFLELGVPIQVVAWQTGFPGIDTQADYEAFLGRVSQRT